MLVENNLVDKTPHKGYSVRQLELQAIQELYDVRLALESFVIERLAQNGYPESEWKELYRAWQGLRKVAQTESLDFPKLDEEFHEQLAIWTGNRALLQQIHSIDERLHFIRMNDITNVERLQATCEQHLRILDCIRNKDAACAREALQMNIENGRENVENAVKEALAKAYMGHKAGA